METLHLVLRYVHLLGFAALTIGALMQWGASQRVVNKLMLWGALTQLVTGFVLVGFLESLDEDVNMTKITVKLVLVIIITTFVFIYRKKNFSPNAYFILLALIIGTSLTAVFM